MWLEQLHTLNLNLKISDWRQIKNNNNLYLFIKIMIPWTVWRRGRRKNPSFTSWWAFDAVVQLLFAFVVRDFLFMRFFRVLIGYLLWPVDDGSLSAQYPNWICMGQLECYSVISRYDHRVTWMNDQITWLTDLQFTFVCSRCWVEHLQGD